MEVYQEALKQPTLAHQLREVKIISGIYLPFDYISSESKERQDKFAISILGWVNTCIKQGKLSRRLLSRSYTTFEHFKSPLQTWVFKHYIRLAFRNVSKNPNSNHGHMLSTTRWGKIKAFVTGIPGEQIDIKNPGPRAQNAPQTPVPPPR
jgi:hypothetical protein